MQRMSTLSLAALFAFGVTIGSTATAAPLDPADVADMIVGQTFHGTNENDEAFWFWHEGGAEGGEFRAKFENERDGTVFGEGFWAVDGGEICWTWTSWNNRTFCYDRFDYDADKLSMTRTDGEVHVGTLTAGNGEGL